MNLFCGYLNDRAMTSCIDLSAFENKKQIMMLCNRFKTLPLCLTVWSPIVV